MKPWHGAAASLFALLALASPAAGASAGCDRNCLDTMLSAFESAVTDKDAARAPLAIGFRETANAVLTPPGIGPWQTVTAFGPVQRRYFDPVTGNALFFGTLTDRGEPAIASLRLKVEGCRESRRWIE